MSSEPRWETRAIGEVCELVGGGTPPTKVDANFDGDVPWITPKDLSGFSAKRISGGARNLSKLGLDSSSAKLVPKDTVLLTTRAPIGYVAIADQEVSTNQGFRSLVLNEGEDPDFFYYLLKNSKDVLEANANGSTFKELSGGVLKKLQFQIPPAPEQRRISRVLAALDDKIESNRRLAQTLEEIVATLFKARFVDFVGHDDLVESEIGLIPSGWATSSIYDISTVTYGRPFKSELFGDTDGLPLIRIRDLPSNAPSIFTPELRDDARLVRPGDIVVGMDGEFRAYSWAGPDAWLNQRVCAFDPAEGVSRAFLREAIKLPLRFFELTKSGTTVIHLGKSDIDTFKVVAPPEAEMTAFREQADPLLEKSVHLKRESRTLAAVRDALLPRLISGELRVPEDAFEEQEAA